MVGQVAGSTEAAAIFLQFSDVFGTPSTASEPIDRVTPRVYGRHRRSVSAPALPALRPAKDWLVDGLSRTEVSLCSFLVDTVFVYGNIVFLLAREDCGRHCATLNGQGSGSISISQQTGAVASRRIVFYSKLFTHLSIGHRKFHFGVANESTFSSWELSCCLAPWRTTSTQGRMGQHRGTHARVVADITVSPTFSKGECANSALTIVHNSRGSHFEHCPRSMRYRCSLVHCTTQL